MVASFIQTTIIKHLLKLNSCDCMTEKLTREWIEKFIHETADRWRNKTISPDILGWQIQPNTSWSTGYSREEIRRLEEMLDWELPTDIKMFLSVTSGLDRAQINVASHIIADQCYRKEWNLNFEGLRDTKEWKPKYNNDAVYNAIKEDQLIPNFNSANFLLVPIFAHRCIACDKNHLENSTVLSIYDDDVIVYGNNLKEYLEKEFLKK